MKIAEVIMVLTIIGIITLVGNFVGADIPIADAIPGMAFLVIISIIGVICAKVIPIRIPAVAYIVTIGCIVTIPGFPGATTFNAWAQKVNFLALATPILAYAGISIGKDRSSFIPFLLKCSKHLSRNGKPVCKKPRGVLNGSCHRRPSSV